MGKTITFEELIGTTAYSHDCGSFIEIVPKKMSYNYYNK